MGSQSLARWNGESAAALDRMEEVHAQLGGSGPGRRYAMQQVNESFLVMVASRFQRYCRDLHTETLDCLMQVVTDPNIAPIVRGAFILGRQLDSKNAQPSALGSDFGRLGMKFWDEVYEAHRKNKTRKERLEVLNAWRNAIAHQDFSDARLGARTDVRLGEVRAFRRLCSALALSFDKVALAHVKAVAGPTAGW
jgi:hypothetical protein